LNKLAIPSILVFTIIAAGIFAFAPIEEATTVHSTELLEGTVTVLVDEDIDLDDGAGADTVCTVTTDEDARITHLFVDSSASAGDGTFRLVSITIDGSTLFTEGAITIANNNQLAIRDILGVVGNSNNFGAGHLEPIIVSGGDDVVFTFDDNEVNGDGGVTLDVIVGIEGSSSATLECT